MRRTLDELLAAPGLTRGRFALLTLVSLASTATVLLAGAPKDSTPWDLVAAAGSRPAPVVEVARRVPAPAAPPEADPARAAVPTSTQPAAAEPVAAPSAPTVTDAPAAAVQPKPTAAPKPAPSPAKPVSKVGHVFIVSVGAPGPYLTDTLRPQGRTLEGYKPLAAGELAGEIALVAGQQPTPAIEQGCPTYGPDCQFPVETLTLPDQLLAKGKRWRAYFQAMSQPCATADNAGYAAHRNPFIYFRSLTDLGECSTNDVALDALTTDLATEHATPNLSYIAPDTSGQDDVFLAEWAPKILDSAAYKKDGLLIVLYGGDTPGVLLVSQFATAASSSTSRYDAYSVLATIEDLLGLDYLAAAGDSSVSSFAKMELAAGLP
jgi:hypothetical protein